ncbi:MAG: hypothetical protein DRP35_08465, partial [Candidatus Zixiibacteriota bacterium]
MKKLFIFPILFFLVFFGLNQYFTGEKSATNNPEINGGLMMPSERMQWEFERLKDPATGTIPRHIRQKELTFSRTLPQEKVSRTIDFVSRGPYNFGGRTRALAIDVDNENRILAGGVSGGLWETTDAGQNWQKILTTDDVLGMTCLIQDTRVGHHSVWYYGTGEGYGASQSATGAFMLGNGIYKSTDNGQTWSSLTATASNTPQSFDEYWDIVWNISVNPAVDTADVVYVASLGYIWQSNDGGNSWTHVLGTASPYSYFTDVLTTPNGVTYATLSSDGSQHGIFRSPDGQTWTDITPDSFPTVFDRIVMTFVPQNENSLYFLGVSKNEGQMSVTWVGDTVYSTLWKYTYLSGDGTGTGGIWQDLSSGIPNNGTSTFDNFYAQGSYDLKVAVKPDDSLTVFIAGTNIYRSTDGFTSQNNTTEIGGYEVGTTLPNFQIYLNHHPDIHCILFLPSNPNVLFTGSDGGVHKTLDCNASTVSWERLNNGYLTTQMYDVTVNEAGTDSIIIAGLQDNGNLFVNGVSPTLNYTMTLNGDGSFSQITNNGQVYYQSIQKGKVFKMSIDNQANVLGFRRIDPIGASGYLFINPFVVDPNDENTMFIPAGTHIWRNKHLDAITLTNEWDSIAGDWEDLPDTVSVSGSYISTIKISKNPAHILYYGTNNRRLYRVTEANTVFNTPDMISTAAFPNGYMNDIVLNPDDGNELMLIFSNYSIKSIYYTPDSGVTWTDISGNLEQNSSGSGNGPSVRCGAILPLPDGKLYFVGTSTGLYVTDTIQGSATIWTHFGVETIGNNVVETMTYRQTDGLLVIGTHGNGIFSTRITSMSQFLFAENQMSDNDLLMVFPNPTTDIVHIQSSNKYELMEIVN